ncbi:MAG: hypothetical protein WCR45_05365 [Bacteroidaceae bacterium]|nr:hypothetical protein [Bacteroidaceae bacterium]
MANWEEILNEELPLFGHRNWILIVDAAYPLSSAASLEVVATNSLLTDVVKKVLEKISHSSHIRPILYRDAELNYLDDKLCKGSEELKKELNVLTKSYSVNEIFHDEIFPKIDKASSLFKILILKTNCSIPYSSLFIQLDCGYWPEDAEKELRKRIQNNY